MNPQSQALRASPDRVSQGGHILLFNDMEAMLRGRITGLVPSNGTDATNDINITAGACRNAAHDGVIQAGDAWVKALDGSVGWTKGNGVGVQGRPAAVAVSDTTWHLFILGSSRNRNLVDYGFDTSVTAANLIADANVIAAGFDRYRRVFSFKRIAGVNQALTAYEMSGGGLRVELSVPIRDFSTNNPGTNAVTWTTACPSGIKFITECRFGAFNTSATTRSAWVTSPDQTNSVPVIQTLRMLTVDANNATNANTVISMQVRRVCDTAAALRYRWDASDASLTAEGYTIGWEDMRTS